MNERVRNLVLSSSILAVSVVLVFFQIPLLGMGLDLSYVAILVGRRYIGILYTVILMLIYPWFSVGFMGPIGVLFMIVQGLGLIFIDYIFLKNEIKIVNVIIVISLMVIWSLVINFLVIVPMYWYLAGNTYGNFMGDYSPMDSFIRYEFAWAITGLVFNPIKFAVVYALFTPVFVGLNAWM